MKKWYKIALSGSTSSELFIGFTEDLNVVRWFKRKFKEQPQYFIITEHIVSSDEEFELLLESELGSSCINSEDYILDMLYDGNDSVATYRYVDEVLTECIEEEYMDELDTALKYVLILIKYLRWENFLPFIKQDFLSGIRYLDTNIRIPYSHGKIDYNYINSTLLLIRYINKEGMAYYANC